MPTAASWWRGPGSTLLLPSLAVAANPTAASVIHQQLLLLLSLRLLPTLQLLLAMQLQLTMQLLSAHQLLSTLQLLLHTQLSANHAAAANPTAAAIQPAAANPIAAVSRTSCICYTNSCCFCCTSSCCYYRNSYSTAVSSPAATASLQFDPMLFTPASVSCSAVLLTGPPGSEKHSPPHVPHIIEKNHLRLCC